jgi:hypothetical protein
MPSSHILIERLLGANDRGSITLPTATRAFLERCDISARAIPPDLSLRDATIIEVLYRTYLPWEGK